MKVEIEQEEDGRWLAELPELPGVLAYGATRPQVSPVLRPQLRMKMS